MFAAFRASAPLLPSGFTWGNKHPRERFYPVAATAPLLSLIAQTG